MRFAPRSICHPKSGVHFGGGPIDEDDTEVLYPDVWQRQATTGPERLVLAFARGHVDLLLDLARTWDGPYWGLYVLTLSRRGTAEEGRYQSARPVVLEGLERFCARFREFLECDGRHQLWVASGDGTRQVIYDRHQVLYAYGDLERFAAVATARGLQERGVCVPAPHSHHYHAAFDDDAVLHHWDWTHSPLRAGDDD